jgi:hypothetical protein
VANDEITINRAYKLIRELELGNDENGTRLAAAHIKAAKTLWREENFAVLRELDGDVGDHVNKAWEVYLEWLKGKEGAAAT